MSCDGLFVAIGRDPNTALVQDQVELDDQGYLIADETTRTSVPGVFAAGDVRTKPLRQIVTAAADWSRGVEICDGISAGALNFGAQKQIKRPPDAGKQTYIRGLVLWI